MQENTANMENMKLRRKHDFVQETTFRLELIVCMMGRAQENEACLFQLKVRLNFYLKLISQS